VNIKTKITLALSFLFAVILMLGGLGAWYLYQLSEEAKEVLKDNYESLEYIRQMRLALEEDPPSPASLQKLEEALGRQEANITEVGEKEATQELRAAISQWKNSRQPSALKNIRNWLYEVETLNMQAIVRKSTQAEATAQRIRTYMLAIAFGCALITFSLLWSFPGYIADPIHALTQGIRDIAQRNYEKRLDFTTQDEFGELASAFNLMAQKLDEYEHSSLARILFEKRRTETIISQLPDAILGLDENRIILFANPVATQLLGMREQELIGKYAPDVAMQNDLLRTLLQESPSGSSLRIYADEKESYFTRVVLQVTSPDPEQSLLGHVVMLRNVTTFKELDAAKTHFIATISHELKTPISSIKMGLKLLEDSRVGELNAEQQHLLANIGNDSERLLRITAELLDLSQVETGNIQLNRQSVSPREIALLALQSLQMQASQKNIRIESDIADDLPQVQADVEKTAWVLVNFLSNAIRFSHPDSKIIVKVLPQNQQVCFSVQDFGKGIEEKYQQRIFERYFQVAGAPGPKTGTGLGLAISKEFIEAQQGVIGVMSKPLEGSTFYFLLPQVPNARIGQ
jgi:NtrC-family two-component system sensor histidine kinase KinB